MPLSFLLRTRCGEHVVFKVWTSSSACHGGVLTPAANESLYTMTRSLVVPSTHCPCARDRKIATDRSSLHSVAPRSLCHWTRPATIDRKVKPTEARIRKQFEGASIHPTIRQDAKRLSARHLKKKECPSSRSYNLAERGVTKERGRDERENGDGVYSC